MSKRKRAFVWTLAAIVLVIGGGALALRVAIASNGPAVLDGVDRLVGGARDVELVERAATGDHAQQFLSVYRATAQRGTQPVILFVHGGSWAWGSPADYGFIARSLAPEGFVVALSGYRLSEAGRYPAMLEDTARAIGWVRENIARHGGDPDRIYLAGHSAGAYNVVKVALASEWLDAHGIDSRAIRGVIGLAGPYDFYPFDSASTRAAFGHADEPEITQPINHVRGDAAPMLLLTGEDDTTVKPRNTRALAAALERAGSAVEAEFYAGMDHSQIIMALASPWEDRRPVKARILQFIAEQEKASVPVHGETR